MESLEFVQDTTLSDKGIYEVSEGEAATSVAPKVARLQEDLTTERERHLRLLAQFDNYRRRTKQERAFAEETGKREVLLALLDVQKPARVNTCLTQVLIPYRTSNCESKLALC